jgi:hypothetical protein
VRVRVENSVMSNNGKGMLMRGTSAEKGMTQQMNKRKVLTVDKSYS